MFLNQVSHQNFSFLIAERGLEFVREHALDRLGHSTDHALGDWHGYFRSQTDARKEIPTDPRTIKAQITTADLKRQSEKLPEITRNGDVDSQTLDDLIKTIQCKGRNTLNINQFLKIWCS